MATKRPQTATRGGSSATRAKATPKAGARANAKGAAAPAAETEASDVLATAVAEVSAELEAGAQLEAGVSATATLTPTPPPAPLPEKRPGVERRRSPREKHIAPAVLQPPSGDASAEASHGVTVQDLSLGGVGFRAAEKFAPGETYRITLGKGPLLLNARVKIISCRQLGHRQYHVGAEFC